MKSGDDDPRPVPEPLLVAEYAALRAEILQAQQTRGVALALVFAALGATATLALRTTDDTTVDVAVIATALSTFSLVVVAAATHFTAILTLRIDIIAEYIRRYVEAPHGGMWETRWHEAHSRAEQRGTRQPPLATSKGYAVYYGLLAAAGTGEFWLGGGHQQPWLFAVPALPFGVALYLSYGLYARRRRSWENPMTAPLPEPTTPAAGHSQPA